MVGKGLDKQTLLRLTGGHNETAVVHTKQNISNTENNGTHLNWSDPQYYPDKMPAPKRKTTTNLKVIYFLIVSNIWWGEQCKKNKYK